MLWWMIFIVEIGSILWGFVLGGFVLASRFEQFACGFIAGGS
jgi:hypothetical protein